MKVTGFANGLFTAEELDPNIYTSKEPKIKFLQKIIECTSLAAGTALEAKPSKIVAGLEPEKTNAWLQYMCAAATSGKDYNEAVKQVLGASGDKKADENEEPKPAPEESRTEAPKTEAPKIPQPEEPEVKKPPKKHAPKPVEVQPAPAVSQEPAEEEAKKPKTKKKDKLEEGAEGQELPPPIKQKPVEPQPQEIQRPKTPPKEKLGKKGGSKQPEAREKEENMVKAKDENEDEDKPKKAEPEALPILKPKVETKGAGQGAFAKIADEDIKKAEQQQKKLQEENPTAPSQEPKSTIKMGRVGKKAKPKEVEKKAAADSGDNKEEKLVKGNLDDVEYLRSIIQGLTKTILRNDYATAPLSKSMDFISEDVETMTKEYDMWKKQAQTAKVTLEEELKKTEDTIQPLQDKLAEIEAQITEQKEKIHDIKSQIFKNEATIQNLLNGVLAK